MAKTKPAPLALAKPATTAAEDSVSVWTALCDVQVDLYYARVAAGMAEELFEIDVSDQQAVDLERNRLSVLLGAIEKHLIEADEALNKAFDGIKRGRQEQRQNSGDA